MRTQENTAMATKTRMHRTNRRISQHPMRRLLAAVLFSHLLLDALVQGEMKAGPGESP